MNHEQLRQMTFRALDRVKQLGRDMEMSVFDREMDQWYANFLEVCDPEQREEIEYHHRIHEMFNKATQ